MKLAKTEYRGAPALALSTRALELVATTEFGPRIISLRAKDSPKAGNLFFEFPEARSDTTAIIFAAGIACGAPLSTSCEPTSRMIRRSR